MTDRVTLDDLESKLRDLGGTATSAATQAKAPTVGAAAVHDPQPAHYGPAATSRLTPTAR